MGFILLSISIVRIIFAITAHYSTYNKDYFSEAATSCSLIVLAGLVAGLFLCTGGYTTAQEVQTYELQAIGDQTDNNYFSINTDNGYTFLTLSETNAESKNYISQTIKSDNVMIVEEKNCKTPRVIEYCQKPNITFWSFGIGTTIVSYIFYVPEGTISSSK